MYSSFVNWYVKINVENIDRYRFQSTTVLGKLHIHTHIQFFIYKYHINMEFYLAQIPADMVVNAMIVAIAVHANRPNSNKIYQVGSSKKHPVTYSDIRDIVWSYFKDSPWINEKGKPVKVHKLRIMGSMASFHKYLRRYIILSKVSPKWLKKWRSNWSPKVNSIIK